MSKNETKGWICPKCGRVYAPWIDKCQYCGGSTITTTPPTCPYYWWSCPHDWSITTSTIPNTYLNTTTTTAASSATLKSNTLNNEVKC